MASIRPWQLMKDLSAADVVPTRNLPMDAARIAVSAIALSSVGRIAERIFIERFYQGLFWRC